MHSRREELIAGALTGDLNDQELCELEKLRAADPSIDATLAALREAATRLSAANVLWREEKPSPELEERIRTATSELDGRQDADGLAPSRSRPD